MGNIFAEIEMFPQQRFLVCGDIKLLYYTQPGNQTEVETFQTVKSQLLIGNEFSNVLSLEGFWYLHGFSLYMNFSYNILTHLEFSEKKERLSIASAEFRQKFQTVLFWHANDYPAFQFEGDRACLHAKL